MSLPFDIDSSQNLRTLVLSPQKLDFLNKKRALGGNLPTVRENIARVIGCDADASCLDVRYVEADGLDDLDNTNFDVVIGTGSLYSVVHGDAPFENELANFFLERIRSGLPTIGICYSHQLIVKYMGGVVCETQDNFELGIDLLAITETGKKHWLFQQMPDPFPVVYGYKDAVLDKPPSATEICKSNMAFAIVGATVTIQHHLGVTPRYIRCLGTSVLPESNLSEALIADKAILEAGRKFFAKFYRHVISRNLKQVSPFRKPTIEM